ncbi:hypothetical protein hairong_088 [Pseudomonas phage hairong]|nr:hypothetical protein hairong_088 [Pseudomonas phage hairong]
MATEKTEQLRKQIDEISEQISDLADKRYELRQELARLLLKGEKNDD